MPWWHLRIYVAARSPGLALLVATEVRDHAARVFRFRLVVKLVIQILLVPSVTGIKLGLCACW